jgi:ABC-type amino acid transport substrate-binding protein
MEKKLRKFRVALFIILSALTPACFAEAISFEHPPKFNILTEDWVPFQFYTEEAVLDGMAVELLELMLKSIGSEQNRRNMKMVPWARAIRLLANENTIVFSMTKTEQRLSKYQWVGPIYNISSYVYVNANSKLSQEDFYDGNNLKTSIIIGDVNAQYMPSLYVDKDRITLVSPTESPIKMLSLGRVDFIIDNELNFKNVVDRSGFKRENFKRLFVIHSASINYAISLNTSENHVNDLQKALNTIKASSAYTNLLNKYDL